MAGDNFRVFISWSGDRSKAVATVWRDLIAETFDAVTPFMSEENIGAGERGLNTIAEELDGTSFGIIVVTQENQHSQWLNYEAGALSKNVGDQTVRVAPSLVDFERKGDVTGPVGQFQASLLDEAGVAYILVEIAKLAKVDDGPIRKRFTNSWREEYGQRFSVASSVEAETAAEPRKIDDVLDEILTLVREFGRSAAPADQLGTGGLTGLSGTVRRVSASVGGKRPVLVLEKGDWVQHNKYGQGVVEEILGDDDEAAMSLIDFGPSGRVKLMHNHAPIVKLRRPPTVVTTPDDEPPF